MEEKKYLTIDIGGTNIKYALMSKEAEILSQGKVETPHDSLESFLKKLTQIVDGHRSDIQAVAISVPGKVDCRTGTVYFGGSLPYLDGLCFKTFFQEKYGLPAAAQNDAKAAALAEYWLGSLKNVRDGAVVTLGTGVGGGVILDGQLRMGPHFQAGELSWMVLEASQAGKTTGLIGSAVQMVKSVNQAIGQEDLNNGLTAFAAINQKDSRAWPIFEKYCRNIAYVILNMQALYDLTTYAIGGGISAQRVLIEEIKNQYQAFLDENPILKMNLPPIEIVKAEFGNEANLYGALYQLLYNEESAACRRT